MCFIFLLDAAYVATIRSPVSMSQYRKPITSEVPRVLLWFGLKDEIFTVNVKLLNIPMIPSRACLVLFMPLIKERLNFLLAPVTVRTTLLDQCLQ